MNLKPTPERQHHVALLVTLVGQLREMRIRERALSFGDALAGLGAAPGRSLLEEIGAVLDSSTPAEVDAELSRLWASVAPALPSTSNPRPTL